MLTLRPTRAEDLDTVMDLVHDAQRFMATLNIDQWQDGYPDRAAFEQDMALKQSFVLTDETDLLAVCALTEIPEADYETLIKLADYFDVSIDYLLERTDNPVANK